MERTYIRTTTNLFEYAFNNFTKVDVTTQEKSEDIETFLTEDGQSEPNYVMLPNGVDFTALDQKITQDTEDSSTWNCDIQLRWS